MKKIILVFFLSLFFNSIFSQTSNNRSKTSLECDMIVKSDGTKLQNVQVKEITDTKINWKICDSLKTSVYTFLKEDVNLIKYNNGTIVIINPKTFEQLKTISNDTLITRKNVIIVMLNGDKLIGQFIKENDKEITIRTSLDGEIELKFSKIKSIYIATSKEEKINKTPVDEKNSVYSKMNNNAIYGVGGYGLMAVSGTIYYERLFKQYNLVRKYSSFAKVGIGRCLLYEDISDYFLGQFGILTGKKSNHFETSLGMIYFYKGDLVDYYKNHRLYLFSGSIGYRFQKPLGHFIFKTGAGWPEMVYLSVGIIF